ncbi:hypothetical protein Tco_0018032, partial [Tanacetum coccineum]
KLSPLTYKGARSASAIESFALIMLETNAAPPEVTELSSPGSVYASADASDCVSGSGTAATNVSYWI